MNMELLDKWLNGGISLSEMEVLKKDPAFTDYLKIDTFVKHLEMPSQDVSEGLIALKEERSLSQKPKVIKLSSFIKVAAAAAIILLVGYIYTPSLPQTFNTQLAQKETVELPDNSNVILNENSQLSFKKGNWDKNRSLQLDGEAYFEVSKGNVFDVLTNHGTVSVLGTRFNVYDRDNRFEVVCYEGLVGVTHMDNYMELSPGEKVYLENGALVADKKYTAQPSWIHNESTFKNVKIEAVLQELKSVYSINLITENIDVDLRYTGSFTNRDLESALQTITLPLGLNYAIENKNVTIFTED